MRIFKQLSEWVSFRSNFTGSSLGLVATMGNLHPGHVSLIKASQANNAQTIVSIFVNPVQFNQLTDYQRYPRTLDADLQLLEENHVDFVLLPDEKEIYPESLHYRVQEDKLAHLMEGSHRPGHFNGVLTIVMKLFLLIKPHKAYFGEKDYQQYLLIKRMVQDFFMGVEVISCPTIREASGLAYSSRNNLLSPQEREQAAHFARLFQKAKNHSEVEQGLAQLGIRLDYLCDYENRRYIAVRIGSVRLIDNIPL